MQGIMIRVKGHMWCFVFARGFVDSNNLMINAAIVSKTSNNSLIIETTQKTFVMKHKNAAHNYQQVLTVWNTGIA